MNHKLKKIFYSSFFMLFISTCALSQECQVDTLPEVSNIRTLNLWKQKLFEKYKSNPLAHRNYGIEINPLGLFDNSFSSSFSFFNLNRDVEIIVPIHYSKPDDPNELTQFTLDCHYRQFLGNTQTGLYISLFVRYAYLQGVPDKLWPILETEYEHKFGIGIAIGYRAVFNNRLYWGINLGIGRFLIGRNNRFHSKYYFNNDLKVIYDFQVLKIGYAF